MTFEDSVVTVNQVDVTPDLKSAHVYVRRARRQRRKEVLPKLEASRAALQAASPSTSFEYTPHLIFSPRRSIERVSRVLEILQEIEPPPSAEND